jgi:dTDP-glucose pyrophosphorylase
MNNNIQEYFIEEGSSILFAMERLDYLSKKILFLINNNKLKASLTDGDIRRWILKGGDLKATVKEAANYSPKFIRNFELTNKKIFMKENFIDALPILDEHDCIISIVFSTDTLPISQFSTKITVVMMAGGLGTRLFPYTKILPKPLIPVGDIPISEHIMDRFNNFGVENFILIVNHKKNMIKSYFNDLHKKYSISYEDEDFPLGTGGGLSLLKGKINDTFILTNCDILIDEDYKKIYDFHIESGNLITMVCSLKNFKIPYGVIELGKDGQIKNIKEKPQLSFFTNTGMYIVDKKIVEELEKNVCVGFPDIIEKYKELGYKIGVYPINEKNWMDMGQLEDLEKMRVRLYGSSE